MFGINYRYQLNEENQVIKLRPTRGTIIASLAPGVVIGGGLWLAGKILEKKQERQLIAEYEVNKNN